VTDEYAEWFRGIVDEAGLVQTSLAINTDVGIRRDRLMTDSELVDYMRRQIESAAKLGFPLARVQISLTPDSMEALLPIAERYGVTLAIEVHAHHHGQHELVLALRDRYEKLGSPLLGFVADWGATVVDFAPSAIEAYRRRGASEELISGAVSLWHDYYRQGPPKTDAEHGDRFGAFIGLAARHGQPDLGVDLAINGTGLFGPAHIDSWLEIMPWIYHVHGKFFGIDESGEEPSVPVRDLIALLVNAGYTGAISTEYEGWHWNYWDDAFPIVAAEQAVQRSAAELAGSRMITSTAEARDQLAARHRSARPAVP
jgi:sugar phosphate isomerase/epimerase